MKTVYEILRCRYPENGYALMKEVSNASGFERSRSADFMTMSLWPSRGLILEGFELKKSRYDWLKEFKNPAKADDIFKYCDKWWLLTSGESIAKMEEIPETWGWIEIKGEKCFVKKEAPKITPQLLDRSFLACLLRRAVSKDGFILKETIQDQINSAVEREKTRKEYDRGRYEERYNEILATCKEFATHSGIDLLSGQNKWDQSIEKVGKAVVFLKNGGAESLEKRLLDLQESAKKVLQGIESGLEDIKKEPIINSLF